MENYTEGQKELHCASADLDNMYDDVPKEGL